MKYCVLGTGGIGLAVMDEAVKQGHTVVLMNKSGGLDQAIPETVTLVQVDAARPENLLPHLEGMDVLFFCAQVPESTWLQDQEGLVRSMVQACETAKVSLIYLDSLDAYGNAEGRPLSESSPERPAGPVAALRASMAAHVRSRINARSLRACIARCADVYGPRCTGLPLGDMVFGHLVEGKPLEFLGAMDMPHSFIYVKDLARSLLVLADHEDAWGKTWHIPCPQPVCQYQIKDMLRDSANKELKSKTVGKGMFDPWAKKLAEFMFQYENPFVINHSRFSVSFGERTTAHNTAVFETLDWFKSRAGISRRYGF